LRRARRDADVRESFRARVWPMAIHYTASSIAAKHRGRDAQRQRHGSFSKCQDVMKDADSEAEIAVRHFTAAMSAI
jgi:hypothetical protein